MSPTGGAKGGQLRRVASVLALAALLFAALFTAGATFASLPTQRATLSTIAEQASGNRPPERSAFAGGIVPSIPIDCA
jgi:hypothetical protein